MADEDEIDIMGDYSLDSVFTKNDSNMYENGLLVSQNSDLLNCDYTIHPQWLLDKPSANPENWYNSETPQIENETVEHVSMENCITDESGWTEKEKNLLESGIAIFGKSNVRLAQFIGSKTASEVKYYLKNFYMENQLNQQSTSEEFMEEIGDISLASGDIINASQIPASIEEVIAAVSTAKPTVQTNNKPQKLSISDTSQNYDAVYEISGHESNLETKRHMKQSRNLNSIKQIPTKRGRPRKKRKVIKFKVKSKRKDSPKQIKPARRGRPPKREKNNLNDIETVAQSPTIQQFRPFCEGEEIVKIKKVDDETEDIEVNIESSDNNSENEESSKVNSLTSTDSSKNKGTLQTFENKSAATYQEQSVVDMSSFSKSTIKQLASLDVPNCEIQVNKNEITDLEKAIFPEYFDGKSPNKTSQRYLTIRNYIINAWKSSNPNYLYKTPLRTGLKNCGDVNCIGKIHYFLEQIGAINFGCEQVNYMRPISKMIQELKVKEKNRKHKKEVPREAGKLGPRSRIRKKFSNDGEGGCTLAHDDEGHVINKTIVNEDLVVKQRMYIKKPAIRLIYCRPFNSDKPQEYTLEVHLSVLLTMDFHAHTRLSEVMGLIGGQWNPQNKILSILHYEPCKNIASSTTHCDMCLISQAEAADFIHNKGLDILGWFHSHPTFAPEPSQQDLDTQRSVQQWIGHNKPCIGIILSPFSMNGALIASPFRCMIVERHPDILDRFVPYRFEVDVVTNGFNVKGFLEDIERILGEDNEERRIDFRKNYFLDVSITYLDKFISSVRMHTAKCGTIDNATCDDLLQGITKILGK